jgi:hypothetical protein
MIILVMMLLYEYGDFLLYKHRDVDRLVYRDVHRVGLRDGDVMRDGIRYFNRDLHSIRYFLFDYDGNFPFNHNRIGFGDMHWDRDFFFYVDRDRDFDRNRDFLFYNVRNWMWDRYFNFLGNCDCFDVIFFMMCLAACKGMSLLESAELKMFTASEGISCVPQTVQSPFHSLVLFVLFCQSQACGQQEGAGLKKTITVTNYNHLPNGSESFFEIQLFSWLANPPYFMDTMMN